jgi:hypothetical protein
VGRHHPALHRRRLAVDKRGHHPAGVLAAGAGAGLDLGEAPREGAPGAEEERLDGRDRTVERLRDLCVTHGLDVAQVQRQVLPHGQGPQRLPGQPQALRRLGPGFGRRLGPRLQFLQVNAVQGPPSAGGVNAHPRRDAKEPYRERFHVFEPGQVAVHAQPDFLADVLSRRRVARRAQGHVEDAAPIGVHDLGKALLA